MKKLLVAAALLSAAGAASAFAGGNVAGGGDIGIANLIRQVAGASPDGGALATATTPGAANLGGVVLVDKSGSNLTVLLNSSGFTAASESLASLGTIDARGNIVIEGAGLDSLATTLGLSPRDLTTRRLVLKRAGV